MTRSWPGMILLGLALTVALAGCAPRATPGPLPPTAAPAPAAAADDPVTITFGVYEFNRPFYEPMVERFHQANPDVRVRLVDVDELVSGPRLAPATMYRRLAGAADVFTGWEFGEDLVALGIARDLRPLLDADPTTPRDDFFPGAFASGEQGAIAMLPATINVPLLAYNRDLWERAGLAPPGPGWGWADVRAAAERLTRRSGGAVEVYGLMVFSRELTLRETGVVDLAALRAAPPAELRLVDDALVTAATELAGLYRDGVLFTPPTHDDGEVILGEDYLPLITGGRIGIWRAGDDAGESLPFAVGFATFPPPTTASDAFWRGGLHMSAGTRHPEAAWRWMAFVSAEGLPRGQFASISEVPARRSVAERSGAWERMGAEAAAAIQATFDQVGGWTAAPRLSPEQREVYAAFGGAIGAMLDEGQSALEALSAAQARLDARLGELVGELGPTAGAPIVVATPVPEEALGPDVAVVRFYTPEPGPEWRELARLFRERFPQYAVEFVKQSDATMGALGLADMAPLADCFIDWKQPTAADAAALLDLAPLADADPSFAAADFVPGLLDRYRQGGRLLGLPAELLPYTIGYNVDAFAAAGLEPPAASWSLDEFIAAAERLSAGRGDERRYGFAPQASQGLYFFLYRAGAAPMLGSGPTMRPNYADPAVRAAIARYLSAMATIGPTSEIQGYAEDRTSDASYELILDGRAAMWLSVGFEGLDLGETAPFTYDFAALPLRAAPLGPNELFISAYFISADAASPEACWAWISFLSAEPRAAMAGIPPRQSVAAAPGYLDRLTPRQAELARAYAEALAAPAAREPAAFVGYEGYWLLRAVDRAARGADLERELDDAQRITAAYLSCAAAGGRPRGCALEADPTYNGWLPDEE